MTRTYERYIVYEQVNEPGYYRRASTGAIVILYIQYLGNKLYIFNYFLYKYVA